MLKMCIALALTISVVLSPCLGAEDHPAWEPETEQAALTILHQARVRVGELFRFEVEYLHSRVDNGFETEERSRVHVYCDDPFGYIMKIRAIDQAFMKCGRCSKSGMPYKLTQGRAETWAANNGVVTTLNEEQRTYTIEKLSSQALGFGVFADPAFAHQAIPPWFDPSINWDELKSQFRIERVASTPTQLFVKFALKQRPGIRWGWNWDLVDYRLYSDQSLIIDRKTFLPKWWRIWPSETTEETRVYTQFDADPPRRELQVSLNGYQQWKPPETKDQPARSGSYLGSLGQMLPWVVWPLTGHLVPSSIRN